MTRNNLIRVLLGGFLALQVCLKATAQPSPVLISSGSDFSVYGSMEDQQTYRSTSPNFSASGTAYSWMDGSSASGAQTCSFGGGIFEGSGRLIIQAGQANGRISEIASGGTSVYVTFEITNAYHYQFVASVSTVGSEAGIVIFNGGKYSNGAFTASGTLGTNQYTLQALLGSSGSQAISGSGTWSYSLSLIPADITPGRITAALKAAFYSQYSRQLVLAKQLYYSAAAATTVAQRDELTAAAEANWDIAINLKALFLDPLDTNYTVIPQVAAPSVFPLAAGGGITQLEANDYNAWLTNLSQAVGFSTALATSINRAQGAAFAGASYWETAQMNNAVQFEAQLAYIMDQEPALRSNVVAQFVSDGFPAITVTTNDAIELLTGMTTNGFPAFLLAGFADLGTDPQTITNIQEALLTSDPGTMTGGFPGSLVNTNLDSAAHALAAGLRDASLRLINTSLLPGSQFRFDLPTEPGYTYTIQFSQNLADPASWTTIFRNQATTSLLSFTNTPPVNAQTGFYRAAHD
jgi:hypothetical protein